MPDAQPQEDAVTPETLGLSIDELMRVADAQDIMNKAGGATVDANGVESSGRVEVEDARTAKVTGGGRAPAPKPFSPSMIGKLAAEGYSVGQISAMSGALTGKAAADEEEEDETLEGYTGKMQAHAKAHADQNGGSMKAYMGYHPNKAMDKAGGAGGELLKKAMDAYREDPSVGPMLVDASDAFEGFVKTTADHIDGVNGTLKKGFANQALVNQAMSGAVSQTGELIKSQNVVIEALGVRLGIIEATPQQPRGATTASTADGLAKGMPGEAGAGGHQTLSKREILSTLSYMNLEKGMREINGERTASVVVQLEGGGLCSKGTLNAVNDFLQANPGDVERARAYH